MQGCPFIHVLAGERVIQYRCPQEHSQGKLLAGATPAAQSGSSPAPAPTPWWCRRPPRRSSCPPPGDTPTPLALSPLMACPAVCPLQSQAPCCALPAPGVLPHMRRWSMANVQCAPNVAEHPQNLHRALMPPTRLTHTDSKNQDAQLGIFNSSVSRFHECARVQVFRRNTPRRTSLISCAPAFSIGSSSSMARAMETPSLMTCGAPYGCSSTTFLPV